MLLCRAYVKILLTVLRRVFATLRLNELKGFKVTPRTAKVWLNSITIMSEGPQQEARAGRMYDIRRVDIQIIDAMLKYEVT